MNNTMDTTRNTLNQFTLPFSSTRDFLGVEAAQSHSADGTDGLLPEPRIRRATADAITID